MQHGETTGNLKAEDSRGQRHRYISVCDSRNRKVRGLWMRNGSYYVPFWVTGEKSSRRSRLEATTLEAARKEMAACSQQRDQGDLPARGRKPFFIGFAREHIDFLKLIAKNQRSLEPVKHRLAALFSSISGANGSVDAPVARRHPRRGPTRTLWRFA